MQVIREVYRREMIPARVRWWLAAEGMRDWYRVVARGLEPSLGAEAKPVLSRVGARMFARRWDVMTEKWPHLREGDRTQALVMSALYRTQRNPKAAWIFDAMGGAARDPIEKARAMRLLLPLRSRDRWEEITVHLGELLIVLTEDLPAHVPHARKLLGDVCFAMGERFAQRVKKAFGMNDDFENAPEAAIEVLRMSEYVFRVNPKHWHEADAKTSTGFLEGTACPWYARPGWNGAHCGIFGQFQSGISSAFGLRYHLAQTIPKHGGTTCRVDLKPIQIRRPS
jgi:hypothetical protein